VHQPFSFFNSMLR